MSNLAIGLALGASSNNGSDTSAKKTHYCNQVMPVFNPKTATVEDKQNYASCVDHFYPTMSPTDIIVMKIIIVITFLVFIAGGFFGYKEHGIVFALLISIIASLLSFVVLVLFYLGFMFVIS